MTRALMRGLEWIYLIGLGALCSVLVLRLFGPRSWPFELLNHFVSQYLLGAILLCLGFAFMRRTLLSTVALMLALAFAADFQRAPQPVQARASTPSGNANVSVTEQSGVESHPFSLITSNLFVLNQRPKDVLTWLAGQPAEVVLLQEVPSAISSGLRALEDVYPYQFIVEPGTGLNSDVYRGSESMAILSIHPIQEPEGPRASRRGKLALKARLSIAGAEDPWIIAVHPSYPASQARLWARDAYLTEIAGVVTNLEGPVIVAGDFNTTHYAPAFRDFMELSKMSTFRNFPATWPARLGPLGIPIDHVLVRGAWLTDLTALSSIGSDHRGLKAEIRLPTLPQSLRAWSN